MKTIGIIGGMSWESTLVYYRLLNQYTRTALGGHHSAKLVLYSVDFAEIEQLQRQGDWEQTAIILIQAAQALEAAGAELMLIATNTMHKVAAEVQDAISSPLLHIVDALADAILEQGHSSIGLLGTRFTMEQEFYRERLQQHGITVLTPAATTRQYVHDCIFNELCQGQFTTAAKQAFLKTCDELHQQGAEGIVLGCTEIGLLLQQEDTPIKLYDTTEIHAAAAVKAALA
ncbi:aspartate/glutamate racemase family protein [Pseudidiomarina halophila]|uniref:Aspartate/glutamate racemase n=1 Tax=Pseudidiomarina halophila TaxID=1449799 RepID=A0A432XTJ1_9GAMM|nr:aspartate/glutamate racemase family protein [Pseudidiomarina halophila]RUO52058.1 aspartate/glutamate racemase [Pseudidiomarina halophila]